MKFLHFLKNNIYIISPRKDKQFDCLKMFDDSFPDRFFSKVKS